jgi:hypothetical protein
MKNNLHTSINRAITLLNTPSDYKKYISIKLSPPSGCCCSDCWPETWRTVNQAIQPFGPILHEGDVLINKDGDTFVLEQHESGPEILVFLALATASTTLAKSVIDLIITIIKSLSRENRKQPPRIKIVKRYITKGEIEEEENLLEIDIPISKNIEKQIENKIKQVLNVKQ